MQPGRQRPEQEMLQQRPQPDREREPWQEGLQRRPPEHPMPPQESQLGQEGLQRRLPSLVDLRVCHIQPRRDPHQRAWPDTADEHPEPGSERHRA